MAVPMMNATTRIWIEKVTPTAHLLPKMGTLKVNSGTVALAPPVWTAIGLRPR